ncbi:hypothetical protein BLNAU_13280 [Blattamonas nauphoetae]|uniref:Uncharacterized protein n=1 Tax=Blattamonas nauphoetae TaxID=2049346 RepID=A0ABQ9XH50_9EUKA|nr:hypothetical protein BLNAU_13280 [Blattamonas nauphoetae]
MVQELTLNLIICDVSENICPFPSLLSPSLAHPFSLLSLLSSPPPSKTVSAFGFADRNGLMLHVVKQLANPRFARLSENVIDDLLQSMQRWKRHGTDEMKTARFFVKTLCAEGFADLAEQFLHRKWIDAWNWSSRRESLMRFLGQNPRLQNMDWGIFW